MSQEDDSATSPYVYAFHAAPTVGELLSPVTDENSPLAAMGFALGVLMDNGATLDSAISDIRQMWETIECMRRAGVQPAGARNVATPDCECPICVFRRAALSAGSGGIMH